MGDYIERETVRVLTEGLPPMPEKLRRGQTIALARWVGERFGAVFFVRRWKNGQIDDDTAISARLPDGSWEEPWGYGGGGWFDDPLVRSPQGSVEGGVAWSGTFANADATVWDGKAVAGVTAVRITQAGRSQVVPIESPSGAVLVGVEGNDDEEVRWLALDEGGNAVGEGGVLPSADFPSEAEIQAEIDELQASGEIARSSVEIIRGEEALPRRRRHEK